MAKRKPRDTKTVALTQTDNRWTQRRWQKPFIEALRNSANVRYACDHSHVTRQSAYHYRDTHPKFKTQWDDALEDACDILEGRAWKRSETSDALLVFLLKAHRPDKYRERHELTGKDGGPIETKDVGLTDEQRIARVATLLERARARRTRQTDNAERDGGEPVDSE